MSNKLDTIIAGLPFTLNQGQLDFLEHFVAGEGNYLLQGLAGSGKSTIMSVLKKYYGDEIVFFASSGVANLALPDHIGNGTGHAGLSLPIKPATDLNYKKVSKKCSQIFAKSDLVKIIVIDEFFGYNSDNLDVIRRRIERFNKKTNKRSRRKIRLLGVGDSCQQVTIVNKESSVELVRRWGHHLMFKSTVWGSFNFTHAVLNKVERQKDPIFKSCLDVIRYYQQGRFTRCLQWLNRRYNPSYPSDRLLLAATNKTVDVTNAKVLARNTNTKYKFKAHLVGNFNMKDVLIKDQFTACKELRVMCINNDPDGRWVNGSIGTIVDVFPSESVDVLFDNGELHTVEYNLWENKETYVEPNVKQDDGSFRDELKERVVGSLEMLPIVQASAFSISKSQGLTISEPFVIDLEDKWLYTSSALGSFGTNFVYVSLSRAESIDLVTLARQVEADHIKPCFESIEFWNECCEKSVI